MKQHITPKQAKEVSEDEFYKIFDGDIAKRENWYEFHHKKVTIGKMLEYLVSGWVFKLKILDDFCVISTSDHKYGERLFYREELCDELWATVVYKLKNIK